MEARSSSLASLTPSTLSSLPTYAPSKNLGRPTHSANGCSYVLRPQAPFFLPH